MTNDYMPRPDARFHARQNNVVSYLNGHPADSKAAEIWVKIGDPPPTPTRTGCPFRKTQS